MNELKSHWRRETEKGRQVVTLLTGRLGEAGMSTKSALQPLELERARRCEMAQRGTWVWNGVQYLAPGAKDQRILGPEFGGGRY